MSDFYDTNELNALGLKSVHESALISRHAILLSPSTTEIERGVRIDAFSILSGEIKIGAFTHIASNVSLVGGNFKIEVGRYSGISKNTAIFATTDDFISGSVGVHSAPDSLNLKIGGDVIFKGHNHIGANSVILPSLVMEMGASIGPLSLGYNRTLKPWVYHIGNPCREFMKVNVSEVLKNKERFLSGLLESASDSEAINFYKSELKATKADILALAEYSGGGGQP